MDSSELGEFDIRERLRLLIKEYADRVSWKSLVRFTNFVDNFWFVERIWLGLVLGQPAHHRGWIHLRRGPCYVRPNSLGDWPIPERSSKASKPRVGQDQSGRLCVIICCRHDSAFIQCFFSTHWYWYRYPSNWEK